MLKRFPEDRTEPPQWIRHWGYTEAGEKFFLCSLLLAVICLCAPGLAAEPQSDAKPLQQVASDFWAWRMRYQPFSADDIPQVEHRKRLRSAEEASSPPKSAQDTKQ
jgi:hypothetical protein